MKRGIIAALAAAAVASVAYLPSAYVSAPFLPGVPREEKPVRIMFAGDIMLDRNVARSAKEEGVDTLFAGIAATFNDSDVRIANLEGTITTNPSIAQRDHTILRFTFDPEIARQALVPLTLTAVSLANNHAFDFGASGYLRTQVYAEGYGLKTFGHPLNEPGALSAKAEFDGVMFCFVGYHSLFDADTTNVVGEIIRLRPECGKVIVMAHWGEEYVHTARQGQRDAAHEFIDAGADLVVGAHPHVVQDHELYKGRAIFYSLGNFMFDQNFSWGTTHGMLLRADFYADRTVYTAIPTTIKDQKAGLAEGEDRQKVLEIAGGRLSDGQVADLPLP